MRNCRMLLKTWSLKCSFQDSFLENRLVPNIRQNFLLKKFFKIQLVIHYAKLKLVLTRYYSVLFRLFSRISHPQRYISWFLSNFEILKILDFQNPAYFAIKWIFEIFQLSYRKCNIILHLNFVFIKINYTILLILYYLI